MLLECPGMGGKRAETGHYICHGPVLKKTYINVIRVKIGQSITSDYLRAVETHMIFISSLYFLLFAKFYALSIKTC